MTKRIYLDNTYLFEHEGCIGSVNKDERGPYLILDETIFYPQGGGQPSDIGIISYDGGDLSVISVRQVEDEIRHYFTSSINPDSISAGSKAKLEIDKERRLLNAKYHTAAHLLGNVVEKHDASMKAVKGHSFPNEAYVEFQGTNIPDISELQSAMNSAIAQGLKTLIFDIDKVAFEEKFYKLPYEIPGNKTFRAMQIGEFLPVPCGGTHLQNTNEIGKVLIGKTKAKNGVVRIAYSLSA